MVTFLQWQIQLRDVETLIYYARKEHKSIKIIPKKLSLKALQINSSRLIDFLFVRKKKKAMLALPFVKGCFARNRTGPISVESTAVWRLHPEQEEQESSWPAMQHCSCWWQTKTQLIFAPEIPFTKESTKFCVLQKSTAVNKKPIGGLWMKSSATESICAAKGANFKTASKRAEECSSVKLRFLSIKQANKPIRSELTHPL